MRSYDMLGKVVSG